jgi:hypothetical protein
MNNYMRSFEKETYFTIYKHPRLLRTIGSFQDKQLASRTLKLGITM